MVEQGTENPRVDGSIPPLGTTVEVNDKGTGYKNPVPFLYTERIVLCLPQAMGCSACDWAALTARAASIRSFWIRHPSSYGSVSVRFML